MEPTYYYEGLCPSTGLPLRLPRSPAAETQARALMAELALAPQHGPQNGPQPGSQYNREGKMYGILIAEDAQQNRHILKAFSGLLNGQAHHPGWVPPIPGRDQIAAAETETLADLADLKAQLIALNARPEPQQLAALQAHYSAQLQALSARHNQNKADRDRQRQQLQQAATAASPSPDPGPDPSPHQIALAALEDQSRRDGLERRHFKRDRDQALAPLQATVTDLTAQIQAIRQARKARSRQLQAQMQAAYRLMNFLGSSASLRDLLPQGSATGTGDCCAPKLLHQAANQGLRPIALAEFWWGPRVGDKVQGQFYGACAERCQPLMGFLLAGAVAPEPGPGPGSGSGPGSRDELDSDRAMAGEISGVQPGEKPGETGEKMEDPGERAKGAVEQFPKQSVGARFPRPDCLGVPNDPECDDAGRSPTSRAWNARPYLSPFSYPKFDAAGRSPTSRAWNARPYPPPLSYPATVAPAYQRSPEAQLPVVYEDDRILAINKPPGLLSVPGRGLNHLDSVLTRLQLVYPELYAVHRLDQDTSGLLLLAKSRAVSQALGQLFQNRQVQKCYSAIVVGPLPKDSGTIDLPLAPDRAQRPYQRVDQTLGKPSVTRFQLSHQAFAPDCEPGLVLPEGNRLVRVTLWPVTGRTHQLRVHLAQGLGAGILGDRLYWPHPPAQRLYLHAQTLTLPASAHSPALDLFCQPPF